ncbi:MAG: type II toxin-antitoxin system VapC family toxin [Chloroflexota bacterium]|nr:type II toxin-antitoxin system VapC family toxin [Chloroflexota bacterium]MDE2961567.1 type II toxin-antitoxin system VapC family toxin [Chloroflexota bacterium]
MATIVDTNVASEIGEPRAHPAVLAWRDRQHVHEMFTTAVTEAEMRYGLAVMPLGRRRDAVALQTYYLLDGYFEDRILPFDSAAAKIYAEIYASRRRRGRPISLQDCQIAAIARSTGMAIATRNVSDFTDCGIELINPWSTEGTPP